MSATNDEQFGEEIRRQSYPSPKQAEHDGPRVRPSRPSSFKQVPRNTAAPQQPGTVVRPP